MPTRTIITISVISILIIAGLFIAGVLITRDEGQSAGDALRDALPFGEAPPSVTEPPTGDEDEDDDFAFPDEPQEEGDFPVIRQLTDVPVAGMRASSTEETTLVRYIERRTGHVYEIAMNRSEPRRLTNTTIPGVREAYWNTDATSLIIRYLDENRAIKSFLATLQLPEEPISEEGDLLVGTLEGTFLPDNIAEIEVSPNKTEYAYLNRAVDNAMEAVISPFDGSEDPVRVFESPFTEWTFAWTQPDSLFMATRPSSESGGVAYSVDITTGSVSRLLGGVGGFAATQAPNGRILFTEGGARLQTFVYNPQEAETRQLSATTLPEKCVWSDEGGAIAFCGVPENLAGGSYPDDWYKGEVSFSDRIEKRDATTGALLSVFDLTSERRGGIDVVNLQISENDRYLFFRNKKDGTLWSIRLE